jgi:hypothetical protein
LGKVVCRVFGERARDGEKRERERERGRWQILHVLLLRRMAYHRRNLRRVYRGRSVTGWTQGPICWGAGGRAPALCLAAVTNPRTPSLEAGVAQVGIGIGIGTPRCRFCCCFGSAFQLELLFFPPCRVNIEAKKWWSSNRSLP